MSESKAADYAGRWIKTAEGDLRAARTLAENNLHAHACFHAQQAAEKAVKAVWYADAQDPWGHSVQKLIQQLPKQRAQLNARVEDAAQLDRFYIPTRYPNGLPDLTPLDTYFKEDASVAMKAATAILETCKSLLNPGH